LDRVEYAAEAVQSALSQSVPPSEVIVVVDRVPELLERLRERLPPAVRLVENRAGRGLSEARNTGVMHAQGEIIAFLDDDAVAHPDWLRFLSMAFADPKVLAAGGRAVPVWLGSGCRPYWLPEELDWLIGCTYKGFANGVQFVRNVHGSNMCFRRTAFGIVGEFDPRLGGPVFGDDTEICIRIVSRPEEYIVSYDSRAIVWHKVPIVRQRWRYCVRHAFEAGVGKEVIRTLHGKSTDALSAEKSYLRQVFTGFLPPRLLGVLELNGEAVAQIGTMLAVMTAVAAGHVWLWLASHLFRGTLSYRGQSLTHSRPAATGGFPAHK